MPYADTSPEAAAILRERVLRMTPSERIEDGARLCKFARQVMRAGIRHRHPDYDEQHVDDSLARLLWGDELYRKARVVAARPMTDELNDTLREIVARLATCGIAYMLVGSVAALAYGHIRSTPNFDMVIEVDAPALRKFVRSLPEARFYVAEEAAMEALEHETLFNVIDMGTGWKVDLIPRKARAFSEAEFARRARVDVLGSPMFVASLEDVIVAKLEWAKAGGSEWQLEDVRELVRLGAERIDHAHVEHWVDVLGLRELWDATKQSSS